MATQRKRPNGQLGGDNTDAAEDVSVSAGEDLSSFGALEPDADSEKTSFDLDAFAPYRPAEVAASERQTAPKNYDLTPEPEVTAQYGVVEAPLIFNDPPDFSFNSTEMQDEEPVFPSSSEAVNPIEASLAGDAKGESEEFDVRFASDWSQAVDVAPQIESSEPLTISDPAISPAAPDPSRLPRLFVRIGKFSANYDLDRDEMLIGRADTDMTVAPEIAIDWDDAISRLHARVYRRGGDVYIEDLGSTNGTKVNGVSLTPHTGLPLTDGDLIVIGSKTEIAYYK